MRLDPTTLCTICESIALRGSLAAAARAAGIGESTLHRWLVDSKRAAERHDETSALFFEWAGHKDFLFAQIKRAKSAACLSLLHLVLDQTRNGIAEVIYDPSTGRPLQAINPIHAHRTDQWFIDQGLDPAIDRYLWQRDPITDEILGPIYATKIVQVPASLRQKVLTGLIPAVFGERSEVDVRVGGQVIHRVEPAPYIPRAQREPVIDAQYTEVAGELPAPAPERADIAELRARAAKLMATPLSERQTVPVGIVKDASGQPVNVGRRAMINDPPDDQPLQHPETTLHDNPRAYRVERPEPGPERPPSQYPRHSDPRGKMARKIV